LYVDGLWDGSDGVSLTVRPRVLSVGGESLGDRGTG